MPPCEGCNWKTCCSSVVRGQLEEQEFFGNVLQQVGIGRGRKWRVNFAKVKKTVDLSARALTLLVEDSSERENDDADGVDLSGLDTASTRCGGKWQRRRA